MIDYTFRELVVIYSETLYDMRHRYLGVDKSIQELLGTILLSLSDDERAVLKSEAESVYKEKVIAHRQEMSNRFTDFE